MRHLVAQSPLSNYLDIFEDIAEEYGCHPYLTGGSVRDLLLNRRVRDWDIGVTGDIGKIAKAFAEKTNGRLIILDEFFQTYRIIKRDIVFDLSPLRGNDILEDLRFRDYTVNALGIDLLNPASIIDPLGGLSDLEKRRIHLISPSALSSDPLRILRAFRLAAELNFSPDKHTYLALKTYAHLLDYVAKERIRQELDFLFSSSNVSYWLSEMGSFGIFKFILPEIEALKGIAQNDFHHLDVYEHSLLSLAYIEKILDSPRKFLSTHLSEIDTYLKGPKCGIYLKWAALCHDLGKPASQAQGSKGTIFYGHHRMSAEIFSNIAKRLRFSNKDTHVITLLILHHIRPFYLLHTYKRGALTMRAIHRLIKTMESHVIGLFLLAVAHDLATKGDKKPRGFEGDLKNLFSYVMDVYEGYLQIKQRPRLVTGYDIQTWFALSPGPKIGVLLKQVEMAQISGEVSTKEEAKAWLKNKIQDT